ncbi:16S rRNA (cytidine(1402)-2'-O)-methyltransferase [Cognatiyoonia sp. IB215446]|uniref:16S rRNA (cytidine(1402)-2'-O)-methyltransferase n=1 Tax=Cognatiyoonia sp. IB215446 TaxID=3097355 RepID=UPI002A0E2489|nr:16S rRNA (cytidine(1402)-2'-O)-methyltransferase [Cognatiyoonia sp. IB215446]MDX8347050.1 16S rRNA (cytidine(1402)-2'-O)-methyltransferase [Cognatiyoonia sp. IB215446]
MNFVTKPLSAGLYFVATPIGAARDITLRALDILASADVIAAEDTRTTRKLMDIHGVPLNGRQLVAFHDHSAVADVERLVAEIASGKSVAYASEAGTPLVADPGYELARGVIAADLPVISAPGPSAVLAALTASGLATDRFAFVGFLPAAKTQRETEIAALRDVPFTLVFYESPKRIGEMLGNLRDVLGAERETVVCRELTKRFEEITRGTLGEVADAFANRSVKGELVVLVGRQGADDVADMDVAAALQEAMKTMRIKDAATVVAGALGLPRRQVYQIALQMKDEE